MTKRTKKVGTAGRFQSRYGVRSRTRIREIESVQKQKHVCPRCGQHAVKRTSTGIWTCRKCGTTFAGGAYFPQTEAGTSIDKILKGEAVAPSLTVETE